jgi:CRISPR/Cas system CSM-associated protein Csm3 (group 7 of RAMP superfamily)
MIFELNYKLVSLSPLCPGSGSSMGAIHRQVLLDGSGYPLIKGSTVKGTMRYHLTKFFNSWAKEKKDAFQFSSPHNPPELYPPKLSPLLKKEPNKVKPDPIAAIFGTNQMPGQFLFSDARLDRNDYPDPTTHLRDTRTGTAIDRRFGIVRHNHLYNMELIPADTVFYGRIFGQGNRRAFFPDLDEKTPLCLIPLLLGLRLTTHIGGGKSRGLGACRFEPQELKIDQALLKMDDLSRIFQDQWEQFVTLFSMRWEEARDEV